jgi:arsenate reductase
MGATWLSLLPRHAVLRRVWRRRAVSARPYNVLFLCTGNSARSILAESLLNHWSKGKFVAFSAGSYPRGAVNPLAVQLLDRLNLPTQGLRSKSWDEFAVASAPKLDFVFTVCDKAGNEICPIWPGQPMTAHWGLEDPAAILGNELQKSLAFRRAFNSLENRIKLFTALPLASLEPIRLQQRLESIGQARTDDNP